MAHAPETGRLGKFIVYVAFSCVYFRRQKFLFRMYVVRKTGTRKWHRFMVLVSGACVMGIHVFVIDMCACVSICTFCACSVQIVPIEGLLLVNEERQKTFEEILPEIMISK